MAEEHEHVKILHELGEMFKPMFEKSPEGIYLYIDEVHKICNERFARMLGLTIGEWEKMEGFVNKHAEAQDQATIIEAYHRHIHQDLTPAHLRVNLRRKDGSKFKAEIDMIPFPWRGEMIALHFCREVK